jgi:hypothetical protein
MVLIHNWSSWVPVAIDWSLTAINSLLANQQALPASKLDEISAQWIQARQPPQVYIVTEKQYEAREDEAAILLREEFGSLDWAGWR